MYHTAALYLQEDDPIVISGVSNFRTRDIRTRRNMQPMPSLLKGSVVDLRCQVEEASL